MIAEIERTALPERMANLPRTDNGYPVPFFAAVVDGKPDLRILDTVKQWLCVKQRRCGICGELLGWWCAFINGPEGAKNRVCHDPAMHEECARYALLVCPYLARPTAKRTADGIAGTIAPAGMVTERPSRMALIITHSYSAHVDRAGCLIIRHGYPKRTEWWINGKAI